jgi:hypothetical protein
MRVRRYTYIFTYFAIFGQFGLYSYHPSMISLDMVWGSVLD